MNFFKKLFGVAKEEKTPTVEELQRADEKNFDILKFDGVKALKINSVGYAIECFTHALNIKEDLEVRDYLSQAYVGVGDYNNAYQQLEKLAQAQPDNIGIFLRMAGIAYVMENYVLMSASCEKALLVDSKSVEALFLYAKACIGTDDITNAVAMLTKAIALNEEYAEAYLLRGEVYLSDGNLDDADNDAAYLLNNYPDNEEALMLKANIENKRGNAEQAMEYYGKVIDVNPFSKEALENRALLRKQAGDSEGAKSDEERLNEILSREQEEGDQQGIESKVKESYNNINPLGI